MFTARYGLSTYITYMFRFKGLISLIFITGVQSVYSAVRTEYLYNIHVSF